nr:arginine decarboxylase-like [Ziziphus jujuba var. spinosa]
MPLILSLSIRHTQHFMLIAIDQKRNEAMVDSWDLAEIATSDLMEHQLLDRNVVEPCKNQDNRIEIGRKSSESLAEEKLTQCNSQTPQQDKLPPLVNALKTKAEQNVASFHFPGHNRGLAAPSSLTRLIGVEPFVHDLPNALPELDNLFCPEGPILDAQQQAAKLFGSSETWFLVGGTTCGIQASIMATCSPGDILILPRNSHISTISAMIFSGAVPKYIIPDYNSNWDIAAGVTPSQVERAIMELEMEGLKPAAVYVTCPTYHGICSNLSEISRMCHSQGIPLIVDEAHGAHLGFHSQFPCSALQQGADLVVQSTHKVLCSLQQSSMLHMSGNLVDRGRICRCLQTLQSTSPSYLLLASLDAARSHLSENPEGILEKALKIAVEAKDMIEKVPGVSVLGFQSFPKFPAIDPLRLTIGFEQLGLSGHDAYEILYKDHEIVGELVGTRCITFAFNLGTSREHVRRLVSGLKHIVSSQAFIQGDKRRKKHVDSAPFADIRTSLIPRDAFFKSKRKMSIENCIGEVCGELICPYPPGIPAMIPGETITERALNYLLDVRSKGAIIVGASDPQLSSIVVCNS